MKNDLAKTYETNDFIADMFAEILHFTELTSRMPTEYPEAVQSRNNAINFDPIYDEYVRNEIFIWGVTDNDDTSCVHIEARRKLLRYMT